LVERRIEEYACLSDPGFAANFQALKAGWLDL